MDMDRERPLDDFASYEACTTGEVPTFMMSELLEGGIDEPEAGALLSAYEEITADLPTPPEPAASSDFSSTEKLQSLLSEGAIPPNQAKAMVARVRAKRMETDMRDREQLFGELPPFVEEILSEFGSGDIDEYAARALIRKHNAEQANEVLEDGDSDTKIDGVPVTSAIMCVGRQTGRRLISVNVGANGSVGIRERKVSRRRGF